VIITRGVFAAIDDPHLADTLRDEHGGILQWIVDGAVAYQQQGLAPPEVVVAATDEYFENEDLFQQWLADCCDLAPNAYEKPSRLFESFKGYSLAANEHVGTDTEFRQRLDIAGFGQGNSRAKGGRVAVEIGCFNSAWDGLIHYRKPLTGLSATT
jgi:putative DNA primase/helicase